jgi:hypothetical protein
LRGWGRLRNNEETSEYDEEELAGRCSPGSMRGWILWTSWERLVWGLAEITKQQQMVQGRLYRLHGGMRISTGAGVREKLRCLPGLWADDSDWAVERIY